MGIPVLLGCSRDYKPSDDLLAATGTTGMGLEVNQSRHCVAPSVQCHWPSSSLRVWTADFSKRRPALKRAQAADKTSWISAEDFEPSSRTGPATQLSG